MLIKIKTNYGHSQSGCITLKTPKDPPFEVDDEKATELISRGIAEFAGVGEVTHLPADSPQDQEGNQDTVESLTKFWAKQPKPKILEAANEQGIEGADGMTVKEIVPLLVSSLLEKQGDEQDNESETE